MRATVLLVLAVGCGRISFDPIDPPPGSQRIVLDHQIASTELVGGDVIARPVIVFEPISPAPVVRFGAVDGAFTDTVLADDGVVVTLPDPFTTRWRLEYTLEGGVPHELIWTPTEAAHVVVPVVGRLDRGQMPAGAGYAVAPVNGPTPGNFSESRIFTTGVFIDAETGSDPATAALEQTVRFDGPVLGHPEAARGDFAVLVEFGGLGPCIRLTRGFAGFQPPDLVAGTMVAPSPQPTWSTAEQHDVAFVYRNTDLVEDRLRAAGGGFPQPVLEHGYVAHPKLPAFTSDRFGVPSPLLFPLGRCTFTEPATGPFLAPAALESSQFARVSYAHVSSVRFFDLRVALAYGIAAVGVSVNDATTIDFGVPFALAPRLVEDGETFDLGGADGVMIEAKPGIPDLVFELEADDALNTFAADFFEVTLFEIGDTTLVPRRVYISTAVDAADTAPHTIHTPITLDRGLLVAGTTYILRIRVHLGRPGAAAGDFATVADTQSVSTVFTSTFVAF